jgi:hypothetical protein
MSDSKIIGIDIHMSIIFQQYFEVPLDFEINKSKPSKAYKKLIQKFEGQNACVINNIHEVSINDFSNNSFLGFGEFIEYTGNENCRSEKSIKFNSKRKSKPTLQSK